MTSRVTSRVPAPDPQSPVSHEQDPARTDADHAAPGPVRPTPVPEESRRREQAVGSALARGLAGGGATLLVADVAPAKRALAEQLGATWVEPREALGADAGR